MRATSVTILLGGLGLLLGIGCGGNGTTDPPPDNTPPATVSDLTATAGSNSSVTLAWTAPGDDENSGRASAYDLRYTAYPPAKLDWEQWTPVTDVPAPAASGTAEIFTVTSLTAGATYAFGLRSVDEAAHWSVTSNVTVATAAEVFDTTAPGAVTDLAIGLVRDTSVVLTWTAPGDDGAYGRAARYEIRHATVPINAGNWDDATVAATPTAAAAGADEELEVTGLDNGTSYYFGLKTRDEVPHWSGLSNIEMATTVAGRVWYIKPDGSGNLPTIQAAIDSAEAGDQVLVAPGTYTWTSQGADADEIHSRYGMIIIYREIRDLTVVSEAGAAATVIDAEGQGRVFNFIGYNEGMILDGFTITGGDATQSELGYSQGGGIRGHLTSDDTPASPHVRNCLITGNHARYGGGLSLAGQCPILVEDCLFSDNDAEGGGAAFFVNSQQVPVLRDCVFTENTSTGIAGAIWAWHAACTLESCTFYANSAQDRGGALSFHRAHPDTSLVTISGCTLVENVANHGSVLHLSEWTTVFVENSIIAFNDAWSAFLSGDGCSFEIGCCDIFDNRGGDDLPPEALDTGDNFSLDPLFCAGPGTGDLFLQSGSPCAAGNHPDGAACGRIGAHPAGCRGNWR